MPTTVRPRGPLPARVYWTRRLVVLGIPLMVVVVLARVLGGSSDGRTGGEQATQAGATVTPAPVPTAGPTAETPTGAKGRKGRRAEEAPPPEPVLAEPTGPCAPSDIVATPAIATAAGGSDIPVTINLRTIVTEACTWQASAETMTVTITSGSDHIWSSRECPAAIPPQDVVVRQAVDAPIVVTWSARRSDEGCTKWADWAGLGWYHVQAAALGGEPTDVQFELVAPQPGVITKTADPQQGGNDAANGQPDASPNGDTAHTPGEDGGGNSAG